MFGFYCECSGFCYWTGPDLFPFLTHVVRPFKCKLDKDYPVCLFSSKDKIGWSRSGTNFM